MRDACTTLNKYSYVDYTINCADVMAIGEYHITTSDLALTSDLATAEVIEDTGNGAVIRIKAQAGDGKVTVYLNPNVISDKAGNYNDRITIADSLIIDNTPPINNSITINYRANITERNIIVVWTDASTHPIGYAKNEPKYPKGMPADFNELTRWWGDCQMEPYIKNAAKRLVLFAPKVPYWEQISSTWNNVIHYPSTAGKGLEEFTYKEIVDAICNSI